MHNDDVNTVAIKYPSNYLAKPFSQFIHAAACAILLIVAYKCFKRTFEFKSSNKLLPRLKIPFYSLYGIFRAIPSHSKLKQMSLPPTAVVPQVFSGVAMLYPKEKAVQSRIGLRTLIILKKADSVEEFLCNTVLITKAFREVLLPFFGRGLFLSSGSRWRALRKLLSPMFHYDTLKDFVPLFDKQSKVLVDILKRRHHEPWIDIRDPLALCAMDILCQTFLGFNVDAQRESDGKFVKTVARVTQIMIERMISPIYRFETLFNISALGRTFKHDISYLHGYVLKAIKRRKEERKLRKGGLTKGKETKNDVLDRILDCQEKTPDMTEDDVRNELLSFISAGEDTTSTGLAWALYLIGLHPEIQSKIHEELDGIFGGDTGKEITADDLKKMCYLDCVLKESQRLYPAAPFNGKCVLEDCTLADYKIKKGTIVVIDTYDLHRDPDVFPNPEKFDPDRFLPENCAGRSGYAYVPFSGGVRSCIGRRFAVMEEKTVIANVMQNFSFKSLEPRDKIQTSLEIVLRSVQPLKVKFTPRHINRYTEKF